MSDSLTVGSLEVCSHLSDTGTWHRGQPGGARPLLDLGAFSPPFRTCFCQLFSPSDGTLMMGGINDGDVVSIFLISVFFARVA